MSRVDNQGGSMLDLVRQKDRTSHGRGDDVSSDDLALMAEEVMRAHDVHVGAETALDRFLSPSVSGGRYDPKGNVVSGRLSPRDIEEMIGVISPAAVRSLAKLLEDPTLKGGARFAVARYIVDRVLGAPVERAITYNTETVVTASAPPPLGPVASVPDGYRNDGGCPAPGEEDVSGQYEDNNVSSGVSNQFPQRANPNRLFGRPGIVIERLVIDSSSFEGVVDSSIDEAAAKLNHHPAKSQTSIAPHASPQKVPVTVSQKTTLTRRRPQAEDE